MLRTIFFAALFSIAAFSTAAFAWNRSPAVEFGTLPQPLRHAEGLCVDRLAGEFYVADFDYQGTSASGRLAVFDQSGRLLRVLALQSSSALLGCEFRPNTHELYVLDFGASKVLRVDPHTGTTIVFATVPLPVPPGGNGLNALTFDKAGNMYVSDSFQGVIWKTGVAGGVMTSWVADPLLQPTPGNVPPF